MGRKFGLVGSLEMRQVLNLAHQSEEQIETTYGLVPAVVGRHDGAEVVFISRGADGAAAHAIDHRANVAALLSLGVTDVLATAMVGALKPHLDVGRLLLLDQFLDFGRQRHTYYTDQRFRDFDFTHPFCPVLRESLLKAAAEQDVDVEPKGCYVGVEGPRFETSAEVRMYGQLGGDVIGMTVVPECIMAREVGLCYAAVAGVVNPGAGLSASPVLAKDFLIPRRHQMETMLRLFTSVMSQRTKATGHTCGPAAGTQPWDEADPHVR